MYEAVNSGPGSGRNGIRGNRAINRAFNGIENQKLVRDARGCRREREGAAYREQSDWFSL